MFKKGIPHSNIHKKNISKALKKYYKENPKKNLGKKNPNWKGGIIYDRKRKLIYSPNHPHPDFLKKYCYEYKLKMEKKLGRFLKKGEIIHHIDGDETNNKITNLKVMTQKKHIHLHKNQGDMKKKYNWIINRDEKGKIKSQTRGLKN